MIERGRDLPSVQMKHLQRHTHRHRRRTAATPHTDSRMTMAGPTESTHTKHTPTINPQRCLCFKTTPTSGRDMLGDVVGV